MRRAGPTCRDPATERRATCGQVMARKSSYRLGRRLKSSAKDRLDYITYINTGAGDPTSGGGHHDTSKLALNFALGGRFSTPARVNQRLRAVMALGGEMSGAAVVTRTLGMVFAGGGVASAKITAPVLKAEFAGGGAMAEAGLKVQQRLRMIMAGGGEMQAGYIAKNSEAQAVFNAMTVKPPVARKQSIDALISTMKTDGVWSRLSGIYIFKAHDEQAARVNWAIPTSVATVVGAPAFTANSHYKGVSGNNGLLSNVTPDSDPLIALNDAGVWCYAMDQLAYDSVTDIGSTNNANTGDMDLKVRRLSDNTVYGRLNRPGAFVFAGAYGTGPILASVTRTASNVSELFLNGVKQGSTNTLASVAMGATHNIAMLGVNNNGIVAGSGRPQYGAGWGLSLSPTQQAALKAALDTFIAAA